MAIFNKPTNKLNKNLTELERKLGVDLKITNTGDLELNNRGDINLVIGAKNAAQAAVLKLFMEPGGLLYHPEIGTDMLIGEKTVNALDIKMQIIRSLSKDPRFENITAKVIIDGNTIFVTVNIKIKDIGLDVPLQFVVER